MPDVSINEFYLTDIANAIREVKYGDKFHDTKYKPKDMAAAIRSSGIDLGDDNLWIILTNYSNSGAGKPYKPFIKGIRAEDSVHMMSYFNNCPNLHTVDLGACVNGIVIGSLANCANLSTIIFPEQGTIDFSGESIFSGTPLITTLELPDKFWFSGESLKDSSITKIYLKGTPEGGKLYAGMDNLGIYHSAFGMCESLTDLYVSWRRGEYKATVTKYVNGVPTPTDIDILETDPLLVGRVNIHYNYVFDN